MKKILLIGLGKFGLNVAEKLSELNVEVMGIDESEEAVNDALPFLTNALIGDTTDEKFMRTVDVDQFDLVIVTIGDNFQNSLETTDLVKELGAKKVVSRAVRDVQAKFLLKNGADEVVYPERQLAEWTAIRYSTERILDFIAINKDFAIFEVETPEEWKGMRMSELDLRRKYAVNILGIKRGENLDLKINGDTVIDGSGDMLVLGTLEDVRKCFKLKDE